MFSLNTPNTPPESQSRRGFLRLGLAGVATAATVVLQACGGTSSPSPETVDTTPPKIDTFSVKNGSALTVNPDGSYSVSGNLGTTQEYILSFGEKLGAPEYTVKMLDGNNAPVDLPAGVTATLIANDARRNLSYTLKIVTDANLVFDAGQASKTLKLQSTVADEKGNETPVNITETVNMLAPVVPVNIPTSFVVNSDSGSINLATYMQPGWTIEVVSVADPGAANGAGAPNVSVNGSIVNISVPTFYGTYDIPLTLRFMNPAGNSSNFLITAINIGA